MPRLQVEVATTPREKAEGLSNRESLAPDSGMLFTFANSDILSFWMWRCTIPLSIAFVREDWVIDSIKELTPLDTSSVVSSGECKFALEVNSGWFETNKISVGDTVVWDTRSTVEFLSAKTAQTLFIPPAAISDLGNGVGKSVAAWWKDGHFSWYREHENAPEDSYSLGLGYAAIRLFFDSKLAFDNRLYIIMKNPDPAKAQEITLDLIMAGLITESAQVSLEAPDGTGDYLSVSRLMKTASNSDWSPGYCFVCGACDVAWDETPVVCRVCGASWPDEKTYDAEGLASGHMSWTSGGWEDIADKPKTARLRRDYKKPIIVSKKTS